MPLKAGTEDKKKVIIVAVLGAIVLLLVLRTVIRVLAPGAPPPPMPPTIAQGSASPAASTASQATTPSSPQPEAASTTAQPEHEAAKLPNSLAALDPTLHPEWMAATESLVYSGDGRNIFSMSSAPAVPIEKPLAPARPGAVGTRTEVAQGPPPPPVINMKFFGYEAHANGTRKAFLLHGDDVYIASAGDVVDHRYKVVSIAPLSIQVEDIPYGDTQTLPLIQN